MNPKYSFYRKILFFFFFSLASILGLFLPITTYAQNTTGQDCIVKIDGTTLVGTKDENVFPVIYPINPIDKDGKVTVNVDVFPPEEENFNDLTGESIVVSYNKWRTGGWVKGTLYKGTRAPGVFSGQLTYQVNTSETSSATFDIEFDDGKEVCLGRFGKVTGAASTKVAPWLAAEDAFCKSIYISPSKDIIDTTDLTMGADWSNLCEGPICTDPTGQQRHYFIKLVDAGGQKRAEIEQISGGSKTLSKRIGKLPVGKYTVTAYDSLGKGLSGKLDQNASQCVLGFNVGISSNTGGIIQQPGTGSSGPQSYDLCGQIPLTDGTGATIPGAAAKKTACTSCAKGDGRTNVAGLWTAVGCIQANDGGKGIVTAMIKIGLSLGGGVALLMIVAAGFMLTTSQGEPKRAGEARDMMTSAVVGLLFIIFSVTILQFIGVSILQIPGFGKSATVIPATK